jgi:hypothetical protein
MDELVSKSYGGQLLWSEEESYQVLSAPSGKSSSVIRIRFDHLRGFSAVLAHALSGNVTRFSCLGSDAVDWRYNFEAKHLAATIIPGLAKDITTESRIDDWVLDEKIWQEFSEDLTKALKQQGSKAFLSSFSLAKFLSQQQLRMPAAELHKDSLAHILHGPRS